MKKVMIVDDEIMVRVGMKSIIDWESQGFTIVAECSNGREALERIAVQEPDLVLTDLMMSEMDGFELMRVCAERYPDIKFIILSNYNDFENTRRAIQIGALDYIFKLTITPDELVEILSRSKKHLVKKEDSDDMFLRKNIPGIKGHLIRMAAEGSCKDWAAMEKDMRRVAPNCRFDRPYCVLHISIDEAGQLPDLQLMKYGIGNMIEEVMAGCCAEVYNYVLHDLLVVFNSESFADNSAICEFAQKKFDLIHEYLQRYYSIQVTGALSGQVQGLKNMCAAVAQTNEVIRYRMREECGFLHTNLTIVRPEVRAAKDYVERNLHEPISLENAAGAVRMSPSYFSHVFREETGMTFTDYVNRTRVKQACRLLANSHKKIGEIAWEVGVENVNYFSVLFKKIVGESPVAYRERRQTTEEILES